MPLIFLYTLRWDSKNTNVHIVWLRAGSQYEFTSILWDTEEETYGPSLKKLGVQPLNIHRNPSAA